MQWHEDRIEISNPGGFPEGVRLDNLRLLNHLYMQRRIKAEEAAKIIQKPENEARAALEHLVEGGLLETSGEGKARAYHLCASTYRRLGEREKKMRGKCTVSNVNVLVHF